MTKIIGITSVGTYYSPWFGYGIASIYNLCDEIIVSNFGYDTFNPDINVFKSLPRASAEIKHLDVNGKITELKDITPDTPLKKMPLMTQKRAEELRTNEWYDVRGISITSASDEARRREADWVLKIDSDQACYQDILKIRPHLEVLPVDGLYLHQYEFVGDIGNGKAYLSNPPPTSPYNDSAFIYRSFPGQYYGGGGSPALYLRGQDRIGSQLYHCAHLRQCNPVWLSDHEKFDHFFGRYWFAEFTNNYGKFCRELDMRAKTLTDEKLKQIAGLYQDSLRTPVNELGNISNFTPEVCYFKDPLEYINADY